MTQCYGTTLKKKRCKKSGPNNGYCHHHITQDLSTRPICTTLTSRGVRCTLPECNTYNACELHISSMRNTNAWVIKNNKTIVVFNRFQKMEDYLQRSKHNFIIHRQFFYEQSHDHLTKEVSPTKIDVLINLINKFIGTNYVWIAVGLHLRMRTVEIVKVNCKHDLKNASIYCLEIAEIYNICDLSSQIVIP